MRLPSQQWLRSGAQLNFSAGQEPEAPSLSPLSPGHLTLEDKDLVSISSQLFPSHHSISKRQKVFPTYNLVVFPQEPLLLMISPEAFKDSLEGLLADVCVSQHNLLGLTQASYDVQEYLGQTHHGQDDMKSPASLKCVTRVVNPSVTRVVNIYPR